VPVDDEGGYKTTLKVADGEHHVEVYAVDVAGRSLDETSPRIVVDTKTDFKVQPPKWR
jgi:hypothetical protein